MKLLEPCCIGGMQIRNRIVMPPMVTNYGDLNGCVTERVKNHYKTRALGGAGLIIVEATYIHSGGRLFLNQLGISNDKFIMGMSQLVAVIHEHGAKAAIQLNHGGSKAPSYLTRMQPIAPSALSAPGGEIPRQLGVAEIVEVIDFFAKAALRAWQSGFDGVEIHGASGYLVDQFLSRSTNKRKNDYGGDTLCRTRFLIEVIRTVKQTVGKGYPVWCRINGRQYGVEEGTTLEESQVTARLAEEAGADAFHISAFGPTAPTNLTTHVFSPAVIEDLAEGIKKMVTVPVIAVGRITPEAGERILAEGKADLISIGKGLLADPELPNKLANNRLLDVTPCTVCFGCRDDLMSHVETGIRCQVNAALGREAEFKIVQAKIPRTVLVVGGGPGGMETARVAVLRGHHVSLWEKESRLGGQLVQAAIVPHKDRIGSFSEYLQTQIRTLGVRIELGKEATAAAIERFGPDVLVLATGAKPRVLEIPGVDKTSVVHVGDVLEGKIEVGHSVVIMGGERVGCETAEFLAGKGKKVTIMRRGTEMALKVGPTLRSFFLNRLIEKGIILVTGVIWVEVKNGDLFVTTGDGRKMVIEVDTIVLAIGSVSEKNLYEETKGKVPAVYLVGDCVEPRTIREAICEGYQIGLRI